MTAMFRVREPMSLEQEDGLVGGIDCVVTPLQDFYETLGELGATEVKGKGYPLFRLEQPPIELHFVNEPISKSVMNIA